MKIVALTVAGIQLAVITPNYAINSSTHFILSTTLLFTNYLHMNTQYTPNHIVCNNLLALLTQFLCIAYTNKY